MEIKKILLDVDMNTRLFIEGLLQCKRLIHAQKWLIKSFMSIANNDVSNSLQGVL